MSRLPALDTQDPTTRQLMLVLEEALTDHFGRPRRIEQFDRRLSAYRTSSPIEEIDLSLDGGERLALIFKNTDRAALLEPALHVKPSFTHDGRREIYVYRALLGPLRLGTATCYGAAVDDRFGRSWLFLERIPGVRLTQVGDFAIWQQAARWLAELHARAAHQLPTLVGSSGGRLRRCGAADHRLWMRRALRFSELPGHGWAPERRQQLAWLAQRYEQVVALVDGLPATLIHGDFYTANVLVEERAPTPRVCPVDWEMAALGPGALDLAALSSGNWGPEQRAALARAYYDELHAEAYGAPPVKEYLTTLTACQILLAVQWLGWSPHWSPPRRAAHDWLAKALRLAGELGL